MPIIRLSGFVPQQVREATDDLNIKFRCDQCGDSIREYESKLGKDTELPKGWTRTKNKSGDYIDRCAKCAAKPSNITRVSMSKVSESNTYANVTQESAAKTSMTANAATKKAEASMKEQDHIDAMIAHESAAGEWYQLTRPKATGTTSEKKWADKMTKSHDLAATQHTKEIEKIHKL